MLRLVGAIGVDGVYGDADVFFVIANIAVVDVHIDAVVVNCVADGVACVSGVFP